MAIEVRPVASDAAHIEKTINGSKQVVLRHMILKRELKNSDACASCLGPIIASVLHKSFPMRSWSFDLTAGCWDAFQIQRVAAG
ncbi:hypothetical protein METH_21230 (plasmid) [Leisingera methylohalidivorans DSM 14336]|uniref:Uncharacterized protein n=1 Tax=Leisingera methylohalidivorans DSM 14336 TaxID=999552 RepID=V9VZZ3_9RHOB|nr:hypothetical protein METH_21230 [Leisingera methylohalidivorans DSM 14336]